ncbi:MAG: TolB family protein, partial [Thermoanaerobaculales bacterium]
MVRQVALVLLTLGSSAVVSAQGPDAAWRTLETPHFRVHYTAPAEPWTLRIAARLEAIRQSVIAEVGYAPPQVVDVVVGDPIAQPNGAAIPLLDTPRIVLWTSAPGPTAGLGEYTDWADLLAIHEETHIVHLLRPSRSPVQRVIEALLPLGPISLRAPRWVHEGYATLVEGRLTGSGRPNGDLRAAVLRQRARAGRLPTYRQMANDSQSWLGMSMAYLAGSAYLEWLEQRAGPDSLKHLWARLTAHADRSFDAAFEGTFGESPEKLYRRFTAELTWRAMEVERRLQPVQREGELWQDLAWTTGEPALSRDGKLMAIVLRDREKASRIVIWSTGANDEAEKKWRRREETLARRDWEDVTAVRSKPLARKPLHELVTRNGAEPSSVRFMPDGRSVLFVRFEPDGRGVLHPDLFRWAFETDAVTRVTRLADTREADPSPDGAWAVAVRNRFGFSQLVRVDLATGAVTDLTPPSLETVCASPRLSPSGQRIVFDRHEEGAWSLLVRELATGRELKLAVPPRATAAAPAWSADGTRIFASLGHDGFVDVTNFASHGDGSVLVTATAGAALAPAPTPDGAGVFYLSLQAEGLALRYLAFDASPAPAETVNLPADLAPAVRPVPSTQSQMATAAVAPGHDYGVGRQELMPLLAGTVSPSARLWELGLRSGDVVGRLDLLAVGALAETAGPRGGLLGATWREWPVAIALQAFDAKERPSAQPRSVPG